MNLAACKERLMSVGVVFERGLTAQELEVVEHAYGFRFPEDLKEFLTYALPVSPGWVDWRSGGKKEILQRMQWPLEGICFDIEHNGFWMEEWGARPASLPDAFDIARERVLNAPRLIPIYSHRFMPAKPSQAGNPVLSVHQTDIIYYGQHLEDYLHNEFRDAFDIGSHVEAGEFKKIEFWSGLAG